MIPALLRRRLRLQPPILNREHIAEDAALVHRLAEEPAAVAGARAQLLARGVHRVPLALEFQRLRPALLVLEELPGAVDRPVAEVAGSREAEGARGERVVEEVADEGWFFISIFFFSGFLRWFFVLGWIVDWGLVFFFFFLSILDWSDDGCVEPRIEEEEGEEEGEEEEWKRTY